MDTCTGKNQPKDEENEEKKKFLPDENHNNLHVLIYVYAWDLTNIHLFDIYKEIKLYQRLFPYPNYGYFLRKMIFLLKWNKTIGKDFT